MVSVVKDTKRNETILLLWSRGQSATIIGAALGVSRNAVIGVVHRAGGGRDRVKKLKAPEPTARVRTTPFRLKSRLVDQPRQAVRASRRPSLDLTLMELKPHHCRFPYGETTPYLFCGASRAPGSSYCEQHHADCYRGF